ncbi:MAG: hypothetical protein NWQ00_04570, partial [Burkholderiaceae bacterium]|nr:hypothetical protein [Burkholderiaceae bacterium]MDP5111698.1 hypothetical protein [Burkholderiaceae bacterium]
HSFQAPTLIGCQIFKEQGNTNNDSVSTVFACNEHLIMRQKQRNEIMKEFFVHVKPDFHH